MEVLTFIANENPQDFCDQYSDFITSHVSFMTQYFSIYANRTSRSTLSEKDVEELKIPPSRHSTNKINIFTVSSQLVPTFEFPISVYKGKVNTMW